MDAVTLPPADTRHRVAARFARRCRLFGPALILTILAGGGSRAAAPSDSVSDYASASYSGAVVKTLADLVAFPTVHQDSLANRNNPSFQAMTAYLRRTADSLGFDFRDAGDVVVIGMGKSSRRLGLITHGDVQPAEAAKWVAGPFTLDATTSPGRLIGRGAEDDKGPIAAALYAMKAVKDQQRPLARRVELMISYTEESDWGAFTDFVKNNPPPDLNVVLDADFPVVVAEKGWCGIEFSLTAIPGAGGGACLRSFAGGSFMSQVPEDAMAVIEPADPALTAALRSAADVDTAAAYTFRQSGDTLTIRARGRSAHSSTPEQGVNALTHLAAVLGGRTWPASSAAGVVQFVNDLVGTGYYAEKFGDIAYRDPFMGPLTLSLSTVKVAGAAERVGINLRRPAGRDRAVLEQQIRDAMSRWQARSGYTIADAGVHVGDPYDARNAPEVPVLLEIYKRYTGQADAKPLSVGGSTHARLVPNGVCFGPGMPGKPYMGHSEHEYIERDDLMLALKMYAAMIEALAAK